MLKPGSNGEHLLQEKYGTGTNANAFYNNQVLDHINPKMAEYLTRQEMMFIATSSAQGECDCSFRAGSPGFVVVIDPKTVLFPDYKGNGVMASLGNIHENPQIGLLFLDFLQTTIGLHLNGKAQFFENEALPPHLQMLDGVKREQANEGKRKPLRWIMVSIEEAYIHCSKNVPLLEKCGGNSIYCDFDDIKAGDFFGAKTSPRPWLLNSQISTISSPSEIQYGKNKPNLLCNHLDQVQINEVVSATDGCEECLKTGDNWVHLRQCLTCGHIGCCDNSRNQHASVHFKTTGHPIIRSIQQGEDWRWCYLDGMVI
jgi:predicted pyridoxine 5'-phosphate oxidase superfamily flavin-nucleotide-binding protein